MWAGMAALGVASLVAPAGGAERHPVQVRVQLTRHRVTAGVAIRGTVVVTNTTRKPITVDYCLADGWLLVELTSPTVPAAFAHPAVACPPSLRLRPGVNRFSVTVSTHAAMCVVPGGQSRVPTPQCTAEGTPPPLPPGSYRTAVDIEGLAGLAGTPDAVRVDVLPAS